VNLRTRPGSDKKGGSHYLLPIEIKLVTRVYLTSEIDVKDGVCSTVEFRVIRRRQREEMASRQGLVPSQGMEVRSLVAQTGKAIFQMDLVRSVTTA